MAGKGGAVAQADARRLPLRKGSVWLAIISPPYFGLRIYTDDGEPLVGQLGNEPTPRDFIGSLWQAMVELWDALADEGSLFVNLGDRYSGYSGDRWGNGRSLGSSRGETRVPRAGPKSAPDMYGVVNKSLMGLPARLVVGVLDGEGVPASAPAGSRWIWRQEITWCLSGGARVYARTSKGDRPIMLRDLVRHYDPRSIKLWNGEKWTQVLGWNESADTDDAIELELRSGERVGCTRSHQWPTTRGLVRADDLRVGDELLTCRLPESDVVRRPSALDDAEVGWFVGLYIAEGSRSEQVIQIAGHTKEMERFERLCRIAAMFDGQCNRYVLGENKATCNLSGSILLGILDRYVSAGTAHTKRLTTHAWERTNEFLAGVVEGYLSGDGHFDAKNNRWRLGFTSNDEWAADLRTLAGRLGCALTLKRAQVTGFGRTWPAWRGEWRWEPTSYHTTKVRSTIVAIQESRARHFYDVGVADEPHLFALASGVLTHNSKENGLPESVVDRARRSHETILHFTKQQRYYANMDELREPYSPETNGRYKQGYGNRDYGEQRPSVRQIPEGIYEENPLGKLPGSVWTINTEPLVCPDYMVDDSDGWRMMDARTLWLHAWQRVIRDGDTSPIRVRPVDHYAAFPAELPRRLILGFSPPGICTVCDQPRRPTSGRPCESCGALLATQAKKCDECGHVRQWKRGSELVPFAGKTVSLGLRCGCVDTSAPTRPAVVLDCFGGSGTTAMVARALGRYGVHMDLSGDYCRLGSWRIWQSGHAARVEARTNGERQLSLLGDATVVAGQPFPTSCLNPTVEFRPEIVVVDPQLF